MKCNNKNSSSPNNVMNVQPLPGVVSQCPEEAKHFFYIIIAFLALLLFAVLYFNK